VRRLEETLHVRLFHRSTRSVRLTAEGAMFLERCRRILGELEAAESEMARTRETPQGQLRVSAPLLDVFTMPAFIAFMDAFPEISLDVDFSDRLVDIIDEGFDVVLRAGEVGDSRLMSRAIGEFHLKLVASPAYLKKRGTPRSISDLADHDCLIHRFATSGKFETWPLRGGGPESNAALHVKAIANTVQPLILMAEQGLGIACLPDVALRRQFAEGSLVTVLDEFVDHSGTFRILWPSSRYLSPKLRVFVDFMADNLFA